MEAYKVDWGYVCRKDSPTPYNNPEWLFKLERVQKHPLIRRVVMEKLPPDFDGKFADYDRYDLMVRGYDAAYVLDVGEELSQLWTKLVFKDK